MITHRIRSQVVHGPHQQLSHAGVTHATRGRQHLARRPLELPNQKTNQTVNNNDGVPCPLPLACGCGERSHRPVIANSSMM